MKQTEKYGLNLLEMKDTLSPVPLNENAQVIDAALNTLAAERLKLAVGSYTGNGAMSVTIRTPGLKPKAMLVRKRRVIGCSGSLSVLPTRWNTTMFTDKLEVDGGWLLWLGWDIPVQYTYVTSYDEEGNAVSGENADSAVRFDASVGSLQWSVSDEHASQLPVLVNNENGVTYDWIVFGADGE